VLLADAFEDPDPDPNLSEDVDFYLYGAPRRYGQPRRKARASRRP
jgi:hypothetical protein